MLTCKQATKLMSEAQDRPLSMKERVSLRLHLAMCSGCTHFNQQMRFIRDACHRLSGRR